MMATTPNETNEPPMPMFEFRDAPQQEVTLPDGRRWTVRVERDTEPHWNGGMFTLNGWYWRWLVGRLRFYTRPRARRHWRVVVVPDAVVSSEQLAVAQTAMLPTPAMGEPAFSRDFPTRAQAEAWAALAFDQLGRAGTLPPNAEV
jgi:hypothetical protein